MSNKQSKSILPKLRSGAQSPINSDYSSPVHIRDKRSGRVSSLTTHG